MLGLTCAVDGCEKPRAPRYRLCQMHRTRKQRHGDPLVNLRDRPETCSYPGCTEPYAARGYCNRHYLRLRDGRPLDDITPSERFWAKVTEGPSGCWLWMAALNRGGYGSFQIGGHRSHQAHRFAYEDMVGPIPQGLELDHLCYVPRCVRPDHLDPVPGEVNRARARERRLAMSA